MILSVRSKVRAPSLPSISYESNEKTRKPDRSFLLWDYLRNLQVWIVQTFGPLRKCLRPLSDWQNCLNVCETDYGVTEHWWHRTHHAAMPCVASLIHIGLLNTPQPVWYIFQKKMFCLNEALLSASVTTKIGLDRLDRTVPHSSACPYCSLVGLFVCKQALKSPEH